MLLSANKHLPLTTGDLESCDKGMSGYNLQTAFGVCQAEVLKTMTALVCTSALKFEYFLCRETQ